MFAQLLDFIDKDVFLRIANKYDGKRNIKQITYWNQLAVLMFEQLSNHESLKDVVLAAKAHASNEYTLDLVDKLPRVLLQMPTRSVIITFSRSLPIKLSRRLSDAESLTSSN